MEESNNEINKYEIESNSIKYNLSLFLNCREIMFKLEQINNKENKLYKKNFSLKDLCKINKTFKIFEKPDECINEFKEYFEQNNNILITESDNDAIIKFPSLFKIGNNIEIKLIKEKSIKDINYNSLSNEMKKIIDENNLILGIDLGTTYSCAAIMIDGKKIIIPNVFGLTSTASYVSFIGPNERYIGELAKLSVSIDKNIIYNSKRLLGKKINDIEIQEIINDLPFKLKKEENSDKILIETNFNINNNIITKNFYPEQISSMILKQIKNDSEYYLTNKIGKKIIINKAVITTPAYFNQNQRESTKQSAEIAGLEVKRMINEPTAACLAYGFFKEENEKRKNIIVIDFGGGTLDLTLLNFEKNENGVYCDIKSSFGNTNFGGEDFDYVLMKKCVDNNEIDKKLPHNIRLKRVCEKTKIKLSYFNEADIILENYQYNKDINIHITKNEFLSLCVHLFEKLKRILNEFLYKSNLQNNKKDIKEILLIGGATRMPKIREIIKDFFPYSEIRYDLNPNEAVAIGASIQGAILSDLYDVRNINLLDVTNLSLGTNSIGNKMSFIIHRSTPIPCTIKKDYYTIFDNQTKIMNQIYEGENKDLNENLLLDEFIIDNLPKRNKGKTKIQLIFNVDMNSILTATAIDLSNINNRKQLTVKRANGIRDILEQLKEEEKNMIDQDISYYQNFKDIIINIQEQINHSQNEKDKNIKYKELIQYFSTFFENKKIEENKLKIYFSYIKYYFLKISEILKYKDFIENDKQFVDLIKKSINNILEYIQVYRNDILEDVIEDFIDNKQLYQYCLIILCDNFFAKAEEFFIESGKNINDSDLQNAKNNIENSEKNFKLSKRLIEKINDEKENIKYLKDNIQDFPIKIEAKKLIVNIKLEKEIRNYYQYIKELINKYMKCKNINFEDIQFLNSFLNSNPINIPLTIEEQFLYEINQIKENNQNYIFELLLFFLKKYPPYIERYFNNNEIKKIQYDEEYTQFHNLDINNIYDKFKKDQYGTIIELISLYRKAVRKICGKDILNPILEKRKIQFQIIIEKLNEIKQTIII